MNPLLDMPFDPQFAQLVALAGGVVINIAGALLLAAALVHFILKPGVAKIRARHLLWYGIIALFIGLLCLYPTLANMRSVTNISKNILP